MPEEHGEYYISVHSQIGGKFAKEHIVHRLVTNVIGRAQDKLCKAHENEESLVEQLSDVDAGKSSLECEVKDLKRKLPVACVGEGIELLELLCSEKFRYERDAFEVAICESIHREIRARMSLIDVDFILP